MIDHLELVSVCQEIGNISEMASWATEGLTRLLQAKYPGADVLDLTLGELLAADAEHREANRTR